MTPPATTVLEDTLRRDVAILSTLDHLHCATVSQLHAICFPYNTLATARLSLHSLTQARFIAHTPWQVQCGSREGGQIWSLTAKGNDVLQRYVPHVPPLARLDLACPSSAIEHEEWRVRLQVRTLLVRLALEVRQTAVLQSIAVHLPWNMSWPSAWGHLPLPDPDACITVTWQPAERKPGDWLPWLEPTTTGGSIVYHPIFLERSYARVNLLDLLTIWAERWPDGPCVPLVILQEDDHCTPVVQQFQSVPQVPAVRLASWAALTSGVTHARLLDERGEPCCLRPHQGEVH